MTGATGRIVVGYQGGATGHDAVAFARRWSAASGDETVVVTVHPGNAPTGADAEWVADRRRDAEDLLGGARALLDGTSPARFEKVDAESAPHGLHDLLTRAGLGTSLLVLGSGRANGMRRTHPGSTAERMLQGSPAPVVLVPWDYAAATDVSPLQRVTVAYVATDDGRVALDHGVRIARHLGAALRVVSVLPDTRTWAATSEPGRFAEGQTDAFREALDEALAGLPDDVPVTGELLEGPVVDALTELRPEDTDLLVCGSRGYGPVRSVLLGGVSSRVLRHARVPVVVVPRGG